MEALNFYLNISLLTTWVKFYMLIGESVKRHPDQPAHSIASYRSPVKEACAK